LSFEYVHIYGPKSGEFYRKDSQIASPMTIFISPDMV